MSSSQCGFSPPTLKSFFYVPLSLEGAVFREPEFWSGWGPLCQAQAARLRTLGCQGETLECLSKTGLPRAYPPLGLQFWHRGSSLECLPSRKGRSLLLFGSDSRAFLALDLTRGQELWCISTDGHPISRDLLKTRQFVNSSVPQFARCLVGFERWRKEFGSLQVNTGNCQDSIARLRRILDPVDPAAFAKPDHWWSQVLQKLSRKEALVSQ